MLPSNSEKIWPSGLPMMLASTLRRPRWAMPMTHFVRIVFGREIGRVRRESAMAVSAPSSEKRFWPMKRRSRKCSNSSAAQQVFEDAQAFFLRELGQSVGRLHALLQPDFLLGPLDVHVLAADLAAVGRAQQVDHLAQGGLVAAAEGVREGIGVEMAVEIPDGEPVGERVEFGDCKRVHRRADRDRPSGGRARGRRG